MSATIYYKDFNREAMDEEWERVVAAKDSETLDPDLKDALFRGDRLKGMQAMFRMDKEFLDKHSRCTFAAPFKLDVEAVIERLFEKAIGVKLEEQDFYPGEAVAGIPLEMWTGVFRNLSDRLVDQMKKECLRKKLPYDMLRDYLMGVRRVAKYCLDNNAQFISYYSSAPGAFLRQREEETLNRLMPKEKTQI